MMGHKTSKLNLARKLKEIKEWLKIVRGSIRLKDWWQVLKAKLTGHYNYFGISGNYWCLRGCPETSKFKHIPSLT